MKIKSYILCDNGNDLFGSHNDGKLIYNLFYNYYLNNKDWLKPEITFNSLFLDFNFDENFILIFFYSGHSNKYGQIKIDNKYYSSDYFLKLINNKNKLCSINFILDTCYSIKFITNKKYTNVIKLTYFLCHQHSVHFAKLYLHCSIMNKLRLVMQNSLSHVFEFCL